MSRSDALPGAFADWFARRGWTPHPHQIELLARAGDPATLLIAPTGGGKTLAGFLPTLADFAGAAPPPEGLHTLYVSPLKALAVDVERNLRAPLTGIGQAAARLGLPRPETTVGVRSGDTPADSPPLGLVI